MGDYHESQAHLEKAIKLAPHESQYHYHLGRVLLSMNELEPAAEQFEQATRLQASDRFSGAHAAFGWTLALPEKDKVLRSRSELVDEMAMLLGGRIAEELIFGDPTTGAANDLERVTAIARSMVTEFGMSPNLGLQRFGATVGEAYASASRANYSDEIAGRIDDEVRALVDAAASDAREILTLHRPVLDRLATALVEHETLDRDALDEIFAGVHDFAGAAPASGGFALDLR